MFDDNDLLIYPRQNNDQWEYNQPNGKPWYDTSLNSIPWATQPYGTVSPAQIAVNNIDKKNTDNKKSITDIIKETSSNKYQAGWATTFYDQQAAGKLSPNIKNVADYMNDKGGLFNMKKINNPFSKGNIASGASTGLLNAGANLVGGAGYKLIGEGYDANGVGKGIQTVGSTAGGIVSQFNPVLGAAITAGSGILGGAVNRFFGMKTNDKALATANANINQAMKYEGRASSFDNVQAAPTMISHGTVYKGGHWNHKAANRKNEMLANHEQYAANKATREMNNNIGLLKHKQAQGALANYSALGGPIDGPIAYQFANDYLTNYANAHKNNTLPQIPAMPMNMNAFGGDLQVHGADWSTGLAHVKTGGTHEENPYGGVTVGADRQGTPNMVEEGETIWDSQSYVFSNRLKVPRLKKKNKKAKGGDLTSEEKILKPFEDKTFAEASKKAEKLAGIEERPNDVIAKRGLEAMLASLMNAQEKERALEQLKQLEEAVQQMSPQELQAFQQQLAHGIQQQEAMQEQQVPQDQQMAMQEQMPQEQQMMPEEQGIPQEEMPVEQMPEEEVPQEEAVPQQQAYGGNLYWAGGFTDDNWKQIENKYNIQITPSQLDIMKDASASQLLKYLLIYTNDKLDFAVDIPQTLFTEAKKDAEEIVNRLRKNPSEDTEDYRQFREASQLLDQLNTLNIEDRLKKWDQKTKQLYSRQPLKIVDPLTPQEFVDDAQNGLTNIATSNTENANNPTTPSTTTAPTPANPDDWNRYERMVNIAKSVFGNAYPNINAENLLNPNSRLYNKMLATAQKRYNKGTGAQIGYGEDDASKYNSYEDFLKAVTDLRNEIDTYENDVKENRRWLNEINIKDFDKATEEDLRKFLAFTGSQTDDSVKGMTRQQLMSSLNNWLTTSKKNAKDLNTLIANYNRSLGSQGVPSFLTKVGDKNTGNLEDLGYNTTATTGEFGNWGYGNKDHSTQVQSSTDPSKYVIQHWEGPDGNVHWTVDGKEYSGSLQDYERSDAYLMPRRILAREMLEAQRQAIKEGKKWDYEARKKFIDNNPAWSTYWKELNREEHKNKNTGNLYTEDYGSHFNLEELFGGLSLDEIDKITKDDNTFREWAQSKGVIPESYWLDNKAGVAHGIATRLNSILGNRRAYKIKGTNIYYNYDGLSDPQREALRKIYRETALDPTTDEKGQTTQIYELEPLNSNYNPLKLSSYQKINDLLGDNRFKKPGDTDEGAGEEGDGKYTSDHNDPFPKMPQWPFQAAMGLQGLGLLHNALTPLDTKDFEAQLAYSKQNDYKPVQAIPIPGYLAYRPVNTRAMLTPMESQNLASNRQIVGLSGGMYGNAMANIQNNNMNFADKRGQAYLQAEMQDRQHQADVFKNNAQVNQFLAENNLAAAKADSEAYGRAGNTRMAGMSEAYRLKREAEKERGNAISSGLSGLANLAMSSAQQQYNNDILGWSARRGTYGAGVYLEDDPYWIQKNRTGRAAYGGRINKYSLL